MSLRENIFGFSFFYFNPFTPFGKIISKNTYQVFPTAFHNIQNIFSGYSSELIIKLFAQWKKSQFSLFESWGLQIWFAVTVFTLLYAWCIGINFFCKGIFKLIKWIKICQLAKPFPIKYMILQIENSLRKVLIFFSKPQ